MIEFIEKVDDNWYFARNADMDLHEGLVLIRNLKVIKKLPGSNTVKGFEDGPCAIAMHSFAGRKSMYMNKVNIASCDLNIYAVLAHPVVIPGNSFKTK